LRHRPTLILIVLLALPSIARAQTAAPGAAVLHVTGTNAQSIELSARDLDAMARDTVNVVDEKGTHVAYEGVPVIEILRRVAAPTGHDIRGKAMTLYLLVSASDGYHAVFALAELDPDFGDRHILLVDRRDGEALSPKEGPFRIIAPDDKRHARWVRNVTSLSIKTAD
jgi:hypothetical protein